ncbi:MULTISPECIES: glucosamine inositolphosphorylceramide transferase family protein [Sphingomonas]|uniref:glucosamine inositolphosphorylceramide transferase family protein n=1 Tax=Sphingomonas TaxID=13687 RepID=UPI000DEF63D9|nr:MULTISPECIES: formyl transferase [Sphingomonas]
MPLRKDIWRSAIACAPFATIVARGSLAGERLVWLPDPGPFRFLADPFGLWRDDRLHIFVEAYDYRVRIGTIEALTYSSDLHLLDRSTVLAEPWHLSYPIVFEAEGETWLLPEAHRGGGSTLYRATDFPHGWTAAADLKLPEVPVDATPVFHQGRWWLLYCPATSEFAKQGVLHAAWADHPRGPWTPHPANPIRTGLDGSRPAGRAISDGETIVLPVQDCRRTYGGATRILSLKISPTAASHTLGPAIAPPAGIAPFDRGLHTLSEAGSVTLFDVKRIDLSARGIAMEGAREWRKLRARLRR